MRETITIETPSKIKVVLYTYLTAREANQIKEEMYKAMHIDLSSGSDAKVTELNGKFLLDQERKLMSIIVRTIDGSDEKIEERLLDMRTADYNFILDEVNKVYRGNLTAGK